MGKTRDLFKKIREIKETFHARTGMIKERNGKDLTEAEEIKKRWQECTEELYKKGLNYTDTKLFKILKDDAVKVLHSTRQQIWKTQQWPQDWKRSVFIPILKKDNDKECSNYRTIVLISHASKFMLKIFQARLQQYMNQKLPDVQGGFQKGRGARDQIANIHWIIEKAREFQKNIYFCFIFYAKAFDCVDHNKLENSQSTRSTRTPLLRNLYAGQEATVRILHGTTNWFKIGKIVQQGYILSPYLFNVWRRKWQTTPVFLPGESHR